MDEILKNSQDLILEITGKKVQDLRTLTRADAKILKNLIEAECTQANRFARNFKIISMLTGLDGPKMARATIKKELRVSLTTIANLKVDVIKRLRHSKLQSFNIFFKDSAASHAKR